MDMMKMAIKDLTDFERGQRDYRAGLICCPFTSIHRVEAWVDGWQTEHGMARHQSTIRAA